MKPKIQSLRNTQPLLSVLLLLPLVACAGTYVPAPSSPWSGVPAIADEGDAQPLPQSEQEPEQGSAGSTPHEREHEHEHETESQAPQANEHEDQHAQQGEADPTKAASKHSDFVPMGYPDPLGTNLTRDWLATWPHSHFSRLGTPFVHPFGLEPAYLDRDLILDYRRVRSTGLEESEWEAELEWALTRRLAIVVEGRVLRADPDGAPAESGLGDVVIAPRALLVDTERLLFSFNLEASLPTGDEDRGLGEGQVGLAPSLSAWFDFGRWIQGDLQIGTEHGLETGDAECIYGGVLAWSFLGPGVIGSSIGHRHKHGHGPEILDLPAGLTSLILELTGRTVIRGADQGRSTQELLFGISHSLTASWELRAAWQIPLGKPEDFDDGLVLGLIFHF
jgi:hypothetical protein